MQTGDLEEIWIMGAVEGRELWSRRRVKERGTHKGLHKENISPELLAGRMRGG